MRYRTPGLAIVWVVAAALVGAARAEPVAVDLELVLAVDTSYSMEIGEQQVQRQGYVDAFVHPQILAAIAAGRHGRIAVTYVEWGGTASQRLPWTLIGGREEAESFSEALRQLPLRRIPFTSISRALLLGRSLFGGDQFRGSRRVVDVSGDGPNNDGGPVQFARDAALAEGIAINGLAIMLAGSGPSATIADLDAYYRACVIGGPGAFVLTVTDTHEFAEAIRQKLYLEIAYPKLTQAEAPILRAQFSRHGCFVGEEMLERH